jgi:hypothetical protein
MPSLGNAKLFIADVITGKGPCMEMVRFDSFILFYISRPCDLGHQPAIIAAIFVGCVKGYDLRVSLNRDSTLNSGPVRDKS